jgi:hypothetical protein
MLASCKKSTHPVFYRSSGRVDFLEEEKEKIRREAKGQLGRVGPRCGQGILQSIERAT